MKFYNREKEIVELKRVQEFAFTQNSRIIVVKGRIRSIGKTSFIKPVLKETHASFFLLEEYESGNTNNSEVFKTQRDGKI